MSTREIVVLIHGIRTTAEWAEVVVDRLQTIEGCRVVPIGYGYFDVLRFLLPGATRAGPYKRLRRELQAIAVEHPDVPISVIAHSFGTYLIGRLLQDDPAIRIKRLLLCGTILSQRYRWDLVAHRIKSRPIINECATRDIWPLLAKSLSWGYGVAGVFGFRSALVLDRFHSFAHSGCLTASFVAQYWHPLFEKNDVVYPTSDERPAPASWRHILSYFPLKYALLALLAVLGAVQLSRLPLGRSPRDASIASRITQFATAAKCGTPDLEAFAPLGGALVVESVFSEDINNDGLRETVFHVGREDQTENRAGILRCSQGIWEEVFGLQTDSGCTIAMQLVRLTSPEFAQILVTETCGSGSFLDFKLLGLSPYGSLDTLVSDADVYMGSADTVDHGLRITSGESHWRYYWDGNRFARVGATLRISSRTLVVHYWWQDSTAITDLKSDTVELVVGQRLQLRFAPDRSQRHPSIRTLLDGDDVIDFDGDSYVAVARGRTVISLLIGATDVEPTKHLYIPVVVRKE